MTPPLDCTGSGAAADVAAAAARCAPWPTGWTCAGARLAASVCVRPFTGPRVVWACARVRNSIRPTRASMHAPE